MKIISVSFKIDMVYAMKKLVLKHLEPENTWFKNGYFSKIIEILMRVNTQTSLQRTITINNQKSDQLLLILIKI